MTWILPPEIALVLDDYQFISSQAAHEAVLFYSNIAPKHSTW
jgi:ATP/maltotriose-dependent transcriptional regulator MalT